MAADPPQSASHRLHLLRWAGWFCFANAVALAVVALRYVAYMDPLRGALARLYLPLALLGQFSLLAYLVLMPVLLAIIVVFPRRSLLSLAAVLSGSAAMCLLLADTGVYAIYRFHLSRFVFDLILGAGGDIFDFSWVTWTLAAGVVGLVIAAQAGLARALWAWVARPRAPLWKWSAACLACGSLVASHGLHAWADANYDSTITTMTRHIPLYYPTTAKKFFEQNGWVDMRENRAGRDLSVQASGALQYPLAALECAAAEVPDILLIVIDSWRFDALTPDITPHISRFAEGAQVLRFDDHHSGGIGTRTGIFTLFYGIPGTYWQAIYAAQRPPVLMQELDRRGYQFGIFASARLTRPAFDRTVFGGVRDLRMYSDGEAAWQRDQDLLADWLAFLDSRQGSTRPLFGFLFFDAVHAYNFPPDYPRRFEPMLERVDHLALDADFDPLPYFNRYKQSAHFVDSLVGRVLEDLRERGLLERTLVMITSDHGEEFNDNGAGYWGHGSNYTRYQTQVPLLVHWPGRSAARYGHSTIHLDLAPTLLQEVLGCTNPASDYASGRSLFATEPREALLIGSHWNYAIVEPDRATVTFSAGQYEIFDPAARRLYDAQPRVDVALAALAEMRRFLR